MSIIIGPQPFVINLNAALDAFVGAIEAISTTDSPLYFSDISSNAYFSVNPGGVISVAASLTSAPTPQTLTVQVCDDYEDTSTHDCATTTITINITTSVIFPDQTFNVVDTTPSGTTISPNITVSPSGSILTITQQVDPAGNTITSGFAFSITGTTIMITSSSLSIGHYLLSVKAMYAGYTATTATLTINVQSPYSSTSGVLTVLQGGHGTITSNLLNNVAGTIYNITTLPQFGVVYKNSAPTLEFSQEDVDNNIIVYYNTNTSATSDFFIYDTNTNSPAQTFTIIIEPVPLNTGQTIGWGILGGVIGIAGAGILAGSGYAIYQVAKHPKNPPPSPSTPSSSSSATGTTQPKASPITPTPKDSASTKASSNAPIDLSQPPKQNSSPQPKASPSSPIDLSQPPKEPPKANASVQPKEPPKANTSVQPKTPKASSNAPIDLSQPPKPTSSPQPKVPKASPIPPNPKICQKNRHNQQPQIRLYNLKRL